MRVININKKLYMRIHPVWLLNEFYKLTRNILALYLFIKFAIPNNFINKEYCIFFIFFIIVYSSVSILLYWKNFKFKSGINLEIVEGTFVKKKRHIPINNILGYSEKSNLLEKIFKLSSLDIKIQTTDNEKVLTIPIISKENSEILKRNIDLNGMTNNDDESSAYEKPYLTIKRNELIKGGISSTSLIIFILFLYSIYEKVSSHIKVNWTDMLKINDIEKNPLILVIILVVLIILSFTYSIVKVWVKYRNFKLFVNKNYVHTIWGFFTMSTNTISKKHISAIIVKSNLIQQLCRIERIIVISMDSDNQSNGTNILIPFLKSNNGILHVNHILDEGISTKKMKKVPFKGVIPRIIRASFALIFLVFLAYVFKEVWYIYILLFIFLFFAQALTPFFSEFKCSDEKIVYIKRGVSKELFYISLCNINEIKITESFIQRFLGLTSLELICKSNPLYKKKIKDIKKEDTLNIVRKFKSI